MNTLLDDLRKDESWKTVSSVWGRPAGTTLIIPVLQGTGKALTDDSFKALDPGRYSPLAIRK